MRMSCFFSRRRDTALNTAKNPAMGSRETAISRMYAGNEPANRRPSAAVSSISGMTTAV